MRGFSVSRRYIHVFNCDVFSVVNVYIDHLKFGVMCIYGRRYVCCSECEVVSNECDEPTPCLVQAIGAGVGDGGSEVVVSAGCEYGWYTWFRCCV